MSTPDYSPARVLLRAADQHPDRLSLVWGFEATQWTVRDSALAVRRLATLLGTVVSARQRIAIIGANSPWHFLVHTAAAWHHAVTVPLSPRLPLSQLSELLSDCQPTCVITDDSLDRSLQQILNDDCTLWTFDDLNTLSSAVLPIEGPPPACSDELAAIVYTSGSSGTPRGVELSHEQLWWGSASFRDGFEYCPATDVIGVCAPLSHIGGFNGTTLDAFTHGGTLVVIAHFDAQTVLRCIEKYRISQMFLVPVMCHLLADAQQVLQADVSSYRNPLIGGDSMGIEVEQRLRDMGLAPIHVWGMTETAGAGAMLSPEMYAHHPGAIGKPFPYVNLRLVAQDGSLITQAGVMGEIQVSGPGVCQRYYNRPEDTLASFDDDWLRTGDLATYDNDGFVHMVGRASRMIHTAGEMVPPRRVEDALRSLPLVSDALVVGVPNKRWGHTVAALLVPTQSTRQQASTPCVVTPAELHDIRNATKESLAPWEMLRGALWVDSLPTTSTGKPDPSAAHDMLVTALVTSLD